MARADATCACAPRTGNDNAASVVAEATQHFITAMDTLKLGMHDVDQLQPPLSDLLACLHRVPQLPPDFEGKAKARDWLARLNGMRASDKLEERDARQLSFDLEQAYNNFLRVLGGTAGSPGGAS